MGKTYKDKDEFRRKRFFEEEDFEPIKPKKKKVKKPNKDLYDDENFIFGL